MKETIAAMFNMADLMDLERTYQHLDKVTAAIEELAKLFTPEIKEEVVKTEEDNVDEEEVLTYDETITYKTIYEESLFYQHFKRLNTIEDFTVNKANQFYCPTFAELFLKKYIAILPLWTRLNHGNQVDLCKPNVIRFSNSYVENYFKYTKKRLSRKENLIGAAPVKCGRFLNHSRQYIHSTAEEYLFSFPKTNCCGYKTPKSAKATPSLKTVTTSSSQRQVNSSRKRRASTSLYSETPKRTSPLTQTQSPAYATPKQRRNNTPQSSRKRGSHTKENRDPFTTPRTSRRTTSTTLDYDKIVGNI